MKNNFSFIDAEPYLIFEDSSIYDAMKVIDYGEERICFVVSKDKKLIKVISDGDIRRNINDLLEKTVGEVATRNPITISSEIFASEALHLMNSHKIGVLVVTDNNNFPKGIFHVQDLLRAGVA